MLPWQMVKWSRWQMGMWSSLTQLQRRWCMEATATALHSRRASRGGQSGPAMASAHGPAH